MCHHAQLLSLNTITLKINYQSAFQWEQTTVKPWQQAFYKETSEWLLIISQAEDLEAEEELGLAG